MIYNYFQYMSFKIDLISLVNKIIFSQNLTKIVRKFIM